MENTETLKPLVSSDVQHVLMAGEGWEGALPGGNEGCAPWGEAASLELNESAAFI